jgi:hypothetical protein
MFAFFGFSLLLILLRSTRIQNVTVLLSLMQVLHPPQKLERPPFWNGCSYGIINYGVQVISNGMNFVQNLPIVDTGRHKDRMVISLAYIFSIGMKVSLKTKLRDSCGIVSDTVRP